ncbi:MAG: hypothetical protein SNJ75_05260 [Gemmataceae bacterium]
MKIETIAQWGWPEVLRIWDDRYELLVPLSVGPRILSFRRHDGPNVFHLIPEQLGRAGEPTWMPRGGHRLWTAPEDLTRTYAPDNSPIQWQRTPQGVILTQDDPHYALRKQFHLSFEQGAVTVDHLITPTGPQVSGFSLWALTVLAPGGFEWLPLPPKAAHPGPPENARSANDYAPNQNLVLWPFTYLNDPRFYWGQRAIHLRQDSSATTPTKLGLLQTQGWSAYVLGQEVFVKEFAYDPLAEYPDRSCNFETFTNADMLEMETLSPLVVRTEVGRTYHHRERWRLFTQNGLHFGSEEVVPQVIG